MHRKRVLHVCLLDKFIPPFIALARNKLQCVDNMFFLSGDLQKYPVALSQDTIYSENRLWRYMMLIYHLNISKKIILHGLFNPLVILLLFFQPWLLRKCNWVMWGGDLYSYRADIEKRGIFSKIKMFIKSFVIRNLAGLVTYIKGDYNLAKEWYGTRGKHIECIVYTSNVYKDINVPPKPDGKKTFLIGNSADPSNNHLEIISKLSAIKDQNIRIICPLSYGDMYYAQEITKVGHDVFGEKFEPLLNLLSLDEYLKVLADVDIAIFAHKRQQAMGNTITLLGMGKMVYIRKNTTTWNFLESINISVEDFDFFDISKENLKMEHNKLVIKNFFSEEKLIEQLHDLLLD